MWTHPWVYVQMAGQDLEYYQIETEKPKQRQGAWAANVYAVYRVLKALGLL